MANLRVAASRRCTRCARRTNAAPSTGAERQDRAPCFSSESLERRATRRPNPSPRPKLSPAPRRPASAARPRGHRAGARSRPPPANPTVSAWVKPCRASTRTCRLPSETSHRAHISRSISVRAETSRSGPLRPESSSSSSSSRVAGPRRAPWRAPPSCAIRETQVFSELSAPKRGGAVSRASPTSCRRSSRSARERALIAAVRPSAPPRTLAAPAPSRIASLRPLAPFEFMVSRRGGSCRGVF